jgi:hypothetical protein
LRQDNPSELHYYLFNDMLLLAAPASGLFSRSKQKISIRDRFELVQVEIRDIPDTSSTPSSDHYFFFFFFGMIALCFSDRLPAALKHACEIVTAEKKYLVAMGSAQEKENFIKDFYLTRAKAASMQTSSGFAIEVSAASILHPKKTS